MVEIADLSTLDFARSAAAFLCGVAAGMVAVVVYRYVRLRRNGTQVRRYVVFLALSYLLLVSAFAYAEINLIGDGETSVSWVVVPMIIVAMAFGIFGLWEVVRWREWEADRPRRENDRHG